jgi:hypothetical protein
MATTATPVALIQGKPAIVTAWHRWGKAQVYVSGKLRAEVRYPAVGDRSQSGKRPIPDMEEE